MWGSQKYRQGFSVFFIQWKGFLFEEERGEGKVNSVQPLLYNIWECRTEDKVEWLVCWEQFGSDCEVLWHREDNKEPWGIVRIAGDKDWCLKLRNLSSGIWVKVMMIYENFNLIMIKF